MWNQLDLFSAADRPYSVSEITGRIRALLEQEPAFQSVWVEGEVSNLSKPRSGHVYLTLKDADAQIPCVIWRSRATTLPYFPEYGDRILVHGSIGVYESGGRYQLYIDFVQPAGLGSLYKEYERLKSLLEAEGLFDTARKRKIPVFPNRIGVVTSPTAAAFRDVLNVLRRRYPQADVLLSPTQVQGAAAPPQIVAALAALNARDDVDVILVVRGGGALEDLWAFNDERVARAIAASRIPVVSGVGHETDTSLADFAADLRAPTPSAAAELATPDRAELREGLRQVQVRLDRTLARSLETYRRQITQLARSLTYFSPLTRLGDARQRVDEFMTRADVAWKHRLNLEKQRFQGVVSHLEALNPNAVLRRGYTIVRDRKTGHVIALSRRIRPGQPLTLQMQDGDVPVRAEPEDPSLKTEGLA